MPLTLSTWVDRSCVRAGGGTSSGGRDDARELSVAFEIAAVGAAAERERPPARTVLAIDVSGSMKGEPLDHVIRSVDRLLDAFGPNDEIGIVTFSDNAARVVDPVLVDATGKRLVRSRVARLQAESNTNIEAGLDLAAEMVFGAPPGMRRGVVLLSDGAPNVGAHTADALREVVRRHRPAVSFFSLGYGVDHCEDVLAAIGETGGGGYEYVQDPAACARAFARALGAQADVVAAEIELVVMPAEGVDVARFVGNEQTRISREGVVVTLPDMINGARRLVVAELRVRAPGRDRFMVPLVDASLRWREAAEGKASTLAEKVTIEVADREPTLVPEAARRVLLARADEVREGARSLADRGQFGAAAAGLRGLMRRIEEVPGWVPNDGTPLAEAYELLLDEATAYERRPSPEQYAAFRKAAVSSRLAVVIPREAKSRGDASQKLIEQVAGDCPPAWLVVKGGGRHRLREELIIGRTRHADIWVQSPQVARAHAEVFADGGRYWIVDLGSTNGTIVNDKSIGRTPHALTHGDVVRVGDVELRYEEAPRRGA